MKKTFTFRNLIKSFLVFTLLISFNQLFAETADWQWAMQAGGVNYNSGRNIVTDNQGNVYATGYFEGTGTFGSQSIQSMGTYDVFVTKLNANGEVIWVNRLGGNQQDYGVGIKVDASGNAYVSGFFSGSMTTSVGTFTSLGSRDAFLAKYDTDGELLWLSQAGSTSIDEGNGIAIDEVNSRVYLTGKFSETLSFVNSSVTLVSAGDTDIFVASYSSADGALQWAKQAGGLGVDIGFRLGVDGVGNIYGTGVFRTSASFDDINLTSNGLWDMFIFKMNSAGTYEWVKNYGGQGEDTSWDIAVDESGNSWITGVFSSPSITFEGSTITNTNNMQDVFVVKFNTEGNAEWANSGGGNLNDYGRGIDIDDQGNCAIIGDFEQTATFGNLQVTSVNNVDIFVVKYSPNGDPIWAKSAGGQSTDSGYSLAFDDSGNLYTTGYFYNNMIFDDITINATVGQQPIFIAKMVENTSTNYTITATAGPNGSINPSGNVSVNAGANQTFAITPAAGYNVANVMVDGVSVGAVTTYTFNNVNANHSISASFSIQSYTITASAGPNGSINPSGDLLVNHGENKTFEFTPDQGYSVYAVIVDGDSIGNDVNYTFTNVIANHSIYVEFVLTTGLNENANISDAIQSWPNPVSSHIYIQIDSKLLNLSNLHYLINDLNGMLVKQGKLDQTTGQIMLNQLKAGLFLLQVYEGENLVKTIKVVKN